MYNSATDSLNLEKLHWTCTYMYILFVHVLHVYHKLQQIHVAAII